ncbi:hypothetical protein [Bradyrhizobium sp. ARR65]|uniref:hypothetical protein n=1 Tax=Bradyrhizobium sp. ARR65 TaxID=1040989 RepID=UPI0004638AA2|nr:hypothetical protein [Bradyrhizobium sp. ARR65]
MPEDARGLPHNEETDSETLIGRRIETRKGLEYSRHLRTGNANSGVDDIDADASPHVAAAYQYPPARFGVFDRVAHEIAKH